MTDLKGHALNLKKQSWWDAKGMSWNGGERRLKLTGSGQTGPRLLMAFLFHLAPRLGRENPEFRLVIPLRC
jgi:hypothetical protein